MQSKQPSTIKCRLLTIWNTVRYPSDGLLSGQILSGCDFKPTGKVHSDHWVIKCKRCGRYAGSEQL